MRVAWHQPVSNRSGAGTFGISNIWEVSGELRKVSSRLACSQLPGASPKGCSPGGQVQLY